MTKAEMQAEIERLNGVIDEKNKKLDELRSEKFEASLQYDTLEDLSTELEMELAKLKEERGDVPSAIKEAFLRVMRNIHVVLPEGEDVVGEQVEQYNLRRGLEDMWTALNPTKGSNRLATRRYHPWMRGAEQE